MPVLLYKYILKDMLRVILLTTAVLVVVIAFGAAIRPIADGQIIGPLRIAKYIGLVIVPMLQFALPFSVGFAATMSFHRMASDNEIVAIAASGISYQRLLMPIFGLGIVLTLVMVMLTQWMIPRFWGYLGATLSHDITELFENRIKSGQPFVMGDMQIYADDIVPQDEPPETGAQSRLILLGVAAAKLDEEGRVVWDTTASRAVIDIYRRENETIIKIIMTDTVVYESHPIKMMRSIQVEPDAVVIPNAFRSNIRAMTRGELLELRAEPDRYSKVIKDRTTLAEAMLNHEIWSEVNILLREQGRFLLLDNSTEGRTYEVEADFIKEGTITSEDGDGVTVLQRDQGLLTLRFISHDVTLIRASGEGAFFDLQMNGVEVKDLRVEGPSNRRERVPLKRVSLEGVSAVDLGALTAVELLQRAEPLRYDQTETVGSAIIHLEKRLRKTHWEIDARIKKRWSLSLTALLLLMLGSVLAIWLRHAQPLHIYLIAFLPSVLDLMLISGGEQMMRDGDVQIGAIVIWTGNLLLAGMIVFAFRKLMRN